MAQPNPCMVWGVLHVSRFSNNVENNTSGDWSKESISLSTLLICSMMTIHLFQNINSICYKLSSEELRCISGCWFDNCRGFFGDIQSSCCSGGRGRGDSHLAEPTDGPHRCWENAADYQSLDRVTICLFTEQCTSLPTAISLYSLSELLIHEHWAQKGESPETPHALLSSLLTILL